MKNIEKKISPLIESQFPSFYADEGPQFVAFVKAYYEWMEQEKNTLYQARRLTDYRDIDSTLDEFILYFKEKYLKNIQFDVASNKQLLIKNSMDLYRAKGTERAVDLFFKLVYGTNAEVNYPREKIFKLSDGVWEKPYYIEVTETNRNIDYVGKLIRGTLSNASAFVERFIKRKTLTGYVNILYISNIKGNFKNGEALSVVINGVPSKYTDSPKVIGSLDEVVIQTGGSQFKVGDIVNLNSTYAGVGGLARVTAVANATGAVDFLFIDGGWGYTNTTSYSIVSEKALTVNEVVVEPESSEYFTLFEKAVQPLVSVTADDIVGDVSVGDYIYRKDVNDNVLGSARIISANLAANTGQLLITVESGTIIGSGNTYTTSANASFDIDQVVDRTIVSSVMGIPTTYTIQLNNLYGNLNVGDVVYQSDRQYVYATGTVSDIALSPIGTSILLTNASGAFKNSYSTYAIKDIIYQVNANTSVNTSYYISVSNNEFSNNDLVLYRTNSSNSEISGLSNNETYFVINATSNSFRLSRTIGGAPVALIPASSSGDTGHYFEYATKNVFYARIAANSSYIDAENQFIKIEGNEFEQGDLVNYYVDAGNTAITGLDNSTNYFVTFANTSGIKLSLTYAGDPIAVAASGNESGHNISGRIGIKAKTSQDLDIAEFNADFAGASFNVGVHDIQKNVYKIGFVGATSNNIYNTTYVYQYDDTDREIAKARVLTVEKSGTDGIMTVVPLGGFFTEGDVVYTDSNTASASISSYTVEIKGGDFVISDYSTILGLTNGSKASIASISSGYGAGFDIGAIGDVESIYINTDILSANSTEVINDERVVLNIGSDIGDLGDVIYQVQSVTFSTNSVGIASNGFITVAGSNPYSNDDIIEYYTTSASPMQYSITPYAGATPITVTMANGDSFYVTSSNSLGFYLRTERESFGSTLAIIQQTPGSNNHTFSKKTAAGTVINANGTHVQLTDTYRQFNTTAGNYSNAINYNTNVNSAISTVSLLNAQLTPSKVYPIEKIRAAAYGFPKSPQGDLDSTIFSCLTFGKFDIGTIGNIYNINPGIEYNVDPFVLAYQPYIANFNRRDYIFTIDNPVGQFIQGEKIIQSLPELTYYDLQVTRGVKDDEYNELTKNFDPKYDVDESSEFIYLPYVSVFVDANTEIDSIVTKFSSAFDVDPIEDFIAFDNIKNSSGLEVQEIVDGDALTYVTTANTIGGLSNNTIYYAISANTLGTKLAVNSTSTNAISLTRTVTNETHSLIKSVNNFISVSSNIITNNMLVRYYPLDGYANVSGLDANTLYVATNASSFGFQLTSTTNTDIISISPSAVSGVGHAFKAYNNGVGSNLQFSNTDTIIYNLYGTGSSIGLSNNQVYEVVFANTSGFKLANTLGGIVNVSSLGSSETGHYLSTIPGYIPGDIVYQNAIYTFNAQTAINSSQDFISIPSNQYADGDTILYYTETGGTSITGANNVEYTVISANSTGIKLSSNGTNVVDLTATATSQFHNIKSTPRGYVTLVYTSGANSFVRVSNVESTFITTKELLSTSFPYIDSGEVVNSSLYQQTRNAEGIVKEVINGSTLLIKRLDFENTFILNEDISGLFSGASANVVSIKEDLDSNPIGVNAVIEANVVTSNGVVTSLSVIDSGLAYTNSEIVEFTSQDNTRAGTGKAVVSGYGISKGYYRSSKGFLSSDIKVHDGDYYQEYSYEVLSKVSFDRYRDMFKKVMHVAGTKLFGSANIQDTVEALVDITNIETDQIVEFNPKTDINVFDNTIDVGIPAHTRSFNPLMNNSSEDTIFMRAHPFSNGQLVTYFTSPGNTASFGLSNNSNYYIVGAEASTFSVSGTIGGNPIPIEKGSSIEWGHFFRSYVNPFSNGDIVEYYTESRSFNKKTDIDQDNNFIYIKDNFFVEGNKVTYVVESGPGQNTRPVSGMSNGGAYYVSYANTQGIKLTNGEKRLATVFNYIPGSNDLTVYFADSRGFSQVDLGANTYGNLTPITINSRGGQIILKSNNYSIIANNTQAVRYDDSGNEEILFRYDETAGDPAIGNVFVIFAGNQYFNKSGENATKYSFIGDTITVTLSDQTMIDYHVTDGNPGGLIPTQDEGFELDLINEVVDFGQANINFTEDFIEYQNVNPQTNVAIFANGDMVQYTARFRNVSITGLYENDYYYVVDANTSGFKISLDQNGSPINIQKDTASFDPIDNVSEEYNFIIVRDNNFKVDDPVLYTTDTGFRPVGGLTNNSIYYVVYANSAGIRVSDTPRGISTVVNVYSTHTYTFDSYADVANTTDFIYAPNHEFVNNELVIYTSANRITPISGLSNNAQYYVIDANSSGFKLSLDGLVANNLTSTESRVYEFTAPTSVDSGNNFISLASHTYITGDYLNYYTSANVITGLANGSNYYVVQANTTGIKLAYNRNGEPISISAPAGTGNSFFRAVTTGTQMIKTADTANTSHFEKQLSPSGYQLTLINNSDNGAGHLLYRRLPIESLDINAMLYVVDADQKTIKLANTQGGDAIVLSAGPNEVGHYLKKIVEE